ncbi:hypothetical protein D9757_011386 [Collybiopsis confluens]|uniref:NAD-dependent epimerase/dehydratase domain-containing protein n=1 Tax=Collybiopsis confluens TaxID=2823264 RepID=A0A8H5LRI1_9AGAR|nr:hypothetical protein D9757_011386 [Collybiopsis confluens]
MSLTGGSGFLGSHILSQLLQQGYTVRAAIRDSKAAQIRQTYQSYSSQLEVVSISDIATDQFPDALKGVTAVIHTAAPLALRVSSSEELVKGAVDGILNVITQAERAGVTKIVATSTVLTAATPSMTFTDKDWYPTTKEAALGSNGVEAYQAAKTIAEQELWKFADKHPHVEVVTLNPPYLYGPFAENFKLPKPDYGAFSTNALIYQLLSPQGKFPDYPLYIDVRDVAKAHILALSSLPTSSAGRKRLILSSPHEVDFTEIIELIKRKRPELEGRLTKTVPPQFPFKRLPFDIKRVETVIGLKEADYSGLEDTLLATIDGLIKFENEWKAKGYEVEVPKW